MAPIPATPYMYEFEFDPKAAKRDYILPDGDTIRIEKKPKAHGSKKQVSISLGTPPDMTWWKAVTLHD